jgi:hypothetical protein
LTKNPSGPAVANRGHASAAKHSTKKAPVKPPAKAKEIVFEHRERDEKHVSQFTLSVLNQIRIEAGLSQLVITSTMRSPAEQSAIMYGHEVERSEKEHALPGDRRRLITDKMMLDPNDSPAETRYHEAQYQKDLQTYRLHRTMPPNYKEAGHDVQNTAKQGIKNHEDPDVTRQKMTAQIQAAFKNGVLVSNHLSQRHLQVVDIGGLGKMTDAQKKKLLHAIKQRFGSGVVRVGHPNGPKHATGREFNDAHCFHIEITNELDEPQREGQRIQTIA